VSHALWRFGTPSVSKRRERASSGTSRHLRNERRLSANTLAAYARDGAHAAGARGRRGLEALGPHDIRRFVATLHGKGQVAALARAGAFELARALTTGSRATARWARNPCNGVRRRARAKRCRARLSPDEAVRPGFASRCDPTFGNPRRALFELAYSCGLRVLASSRPGRRARGRGDGRVRVTGKGAKTRIVPVGTHALAALGAWLPRARHGEAGESALFVGRAGRRLAPREVQKRIKRWAAAAGLDVDVHPHMLRHSFASHVLQSSGDLRAVQEMLGHASIASTQVYTHLDFQHLAKVYDAAHPRARREKAGKKG
jgi:integrase/recombinase XerC